MGRISICFFELSSPLPFAFAGELFLFAWPNKSNQKKSTRPAWATKLACGFSALLDSLGGD